MTTSLARSTEHLAAHRGLIVTHAAAAAVAGLLPIPYVDEWLPSLVRRALIRRLAEDRGVDLSEEAVRELADGKVPPPAWSHLINLGPLLRTARRGLRRLFLAFVLYRRADSASRTFALGTLFDHYCARLHVGGEVDGAAARALRARIDEVVASPRASLGTYLFRRGFRAALRASVRAPIELFHALTAGKLRRSITAGDEVEAEEMVEGALEAATRDEGSFLGRTVRSVDRQLGTAGSGWVEGMVEALERTR
jgi:uncharacterized protein (DUF697 family)